MQQAKRKNEKNEKGEKIHPTPEGGESVAPLSALAPHSVGPSRFGSMRHSPPFRPFVRWFGCLRSLQQTSSMPLGHPQAEPVELVVHRTFKATSL